MKLMIKESNSSDLIQQLNDLEVGYGHSKTSYDLVKQYEKLLKDFDVNTIISYKTSAGTDTFIKVSDDYFGWQQSTAPFYELKEKSVFDIASYIASRGNLMRSSIRLGTDVDVDLENGKYINWRRNDNSNFSFIK